VIGTGTEVGKTIVAAALARALRRLGLSVGVFKPFASDPARGPDGRPFSRDAELLARAAAFEGGEPAARGQLFGAPLAPLAAARLEGRRVDLRPAVRRCRAIARRHDVTLVEGCGGWLVPLTERRTTADFFAALGAPILIVAPAGLGTLNHTLLTLADVRARGLRLIGVVLNRMQGGRPSLAERTNPPILSRFAGLPVWGPLPHRAALAGQRPDNVRLGDLPSLMPVARAVWRAIGT